MDCLQSQPGLDPIMKAAKDAREQATKLYMETVVDRVIVPLAALVDANNTDAIVKRYEQLEMKLLDTNPADYTEAGDAIGTATTMVRAMLHGLQPKDTEYEADWNDMMQMTKKKDLCNGIAVKAWATILDFPYIREIAHQYKMVAGTNKEVLADVLAAEGGYKAKKGFGHACAFVLKHAPDFHTKTLKTRARVTIDLKGILLACCEIIVAETNDLIVELGKSDFVDECTAEFSLKVRSAMDALDVLKKVELISDAGRKNFSIMDDKWMIITGALSKHKLLPYLERSNAETLINDPEVRTATMHFLTEALAAFGSQEEIPLAARNKARDLLNGILDISSKWVDVGGIVNSIGELADRLCYCAFSAESRLAVTAMRSRSEVVNAKATFLKIGESPTIRAEADKNYRGLSTLQSCVQGYKDKCDKMGAACPQVYLDTHAEVEDVINQHFSAYDTLMRDCTEKKVIAKYQPDCATSPTIVQVAGGAQEEDKVWCSELADDATFDQVLAVWKASGANLQPPMLRTACSAIEDSMDAYKRFDESIGHTTKQKEEDTWYVDHEILVRRLNTTMAEGLAIWCMHTLTPVSRSRTQLVLEQPAWAKQGIQMHASVEAAIKRVMKLRKP